MRLNISLFQEHIQDFKQCLRPQTAKRNYESIKAGQHLPGAEYDIYLVKGGTNTPKWLPFIQEYVQTAAVEDLANVINSAVALFKVKTNKGMRIFALAIGNGHHLINRELIEPRFGLLTTLNGVDPKRIKLVDSKRIGIQTLQKREASNLETELSDFGFEFDAELLHVVSGACADEKLGTKLSGSDSLQLTDKVEFKNLPAKLKHLHTVFLADTYKTRFAFIDHIKFEKDPIKIAQLNERLVAAINQRLSTAKIAAAYPDQIEYDQYTNYQFSGLRSVREVSEVALASIYGYLGDLQIQFEHLKRIRITGFANDTAGTSEPLHAYLSFETELKGTKFILCNRKWYSIDDGYLTQLEKEIANNIKNCTSPALKQWPATRNKKNQLTYIEDIYNRQYENEQDYLYLDKQLFSFGKGRGPSKVEVADFFHRPSNKLFCAKRLTASATLNHLFSQATVSAELFRQWPEYKAKFHETADKRWPTKPLGRDTIDALTFVYAIGTERPEDLLELLPVFSKVMLLKHIRMLHRSKFKVEFVKIAMTGASPAEPVETKPVPRKRGPRAMTPPPSP
ncbi:hypothetical protein MFUL124B02_24485 [Myxococcus fulvus 124B02]|nr:hypothetical protein MFUL124B02_24485 [Myxococcus fulvus 124B02]